MECMLDMAERIALMCQLIGKIFAEAELYGVPAQKGEAQTL